MIGGGWAIGLALTGFTGWGRRPGRLGELVPLGSVMAVLGAVALVAGIVAQASDGFDSPSTAVVWWPTLVVALLLVALWLAPGLQGRPVILATALLLVTWTVAGFVAVQVGSNSARPAGHQRTRTTPFFSSPFERISPTRSATPSGPPPSPPSSSGCST